MAVRVHAILHAVPEQAQSLRGEARVRDLSRRAREAACESARVSAMRPPAFVRDALDRPIETEGVYWGISHVTSMVAGVVARGPIAIDVERVRMRSIEQIRAVLTEEEHERLGGPLLDAYFRAWTAKEAVLKLAGAGIQRLSATEIAGATRSRTEVRFDGRSFDVEHTWPPGHVVAVAGYSGEVVWHVAARLRSDRV